MINSTWHWLEIRVPNRVTAQTIKNPSMIYDLIPEATISSPQLISKTSFKHNCLGEFEATATYIIWYTDTVLSISTDHPPANQAANAKNVVTQLG